LQLVPGSPFATEQLRDPLAHQQLAVAYGLDQPWWVQWHQWSQQALGGSLGFSFQRRDLTVESLLVQAWPTSLLLGLLALLVGSAVALPSAIGVVRNPGARGCVFLSRFMDSLLCVPTFVSAPVFLLLLASGPFSLLDAPSAGRMAEYGLAVLALSLPVTAVVFRWTCVALEGAVGSPWWPAVAARQLPEQLRWWRYALGSCATQLTGSLAPLAADVLTGAMAVETVFALPGLGQLLASAARHRDIPVLLGAVVCVVTTVMVVQLLADGLATVSARRRGVDAV
jgi:oligopeptide transport system permease protein